MNIIRSLKEYTGISFRSLFPDKREYDNAYNALTGKTSVNQDAVKADISKRIRDNAEKNKTFSFSEFEKRLKKDSK